MNKYFLILSIFLNSLFGAFWSHESSYVLKKDQLVTIQIKPQNKKQTKRSGDFTFRWTLYDPSSQLIVMSSYQGFKKHVALKTDYNLDSFKIYLNPDFSKPWKVGFIKVVFEKFDTKKQEATFLVFIKDSSNIYNIKL